jgi:hypothetical protein
MCNETLIEVGKSKKTLSITNRNWGSLVNNANEFHFGLMKFTFVQFGIKFNFPELVQNKSNMSFMLFQVFGENEDVINLIDHKII